MEKLFGTDGIRGVANQYPMTPEVALKVGQAVAYFLPRPGSVIIGKDTRISGDMLVSAAAAGVCSMGVDVLLAGILPTPGVASLTASTPADAGIVISASHNPYYDNGIKLFNGNGYKLTDEQEAHIERIVLASEAVDLHPDPGRIHMIEDAENRYGDFLTQAVTHRDVFNGIHMVLDCSNGATCRVAPKLFADLGATVTALSTTPNGKNINHHCGSEHLTAVKQAVIDHKADIGLAFDGDGDRLIAIDEQGQVVCGDQILAICAKNMKAAGLLKNNVLVTTVMSNMGLGTALREMGICHVKARVGDRYVMQEMRANGAVLGGEDSGHIIFLDHHTTGDGILAAIRLIEAMSTASKPLSELSKLMRVFPQVLVNVPVAGKPDIQAIPEIQNAIQSVEKALDGKGRVLVRYSGTQPLCRIMVEGPTLEETTQYCNQLSDIIRCFII